MEVEKEQPVQDKLRLYCVGSAELNQFYIPYNEDKQRPSHSRRPLCLSEIKEFLIIDEDSVERKESIIPNPLLNEKIVGVACGGTFTVINTASGRVYSWGSND
jgi:alpha-tubulin suppressor-like RCC1 family protein